MTEEEITRTKQKLEEIEKEVVEKKAETAYLRKSVEDLLSMMEAAEEEDDDHEDDKNKRRKHQHSDDDKDSDSDSDTSDEFFLEVNPQDLGHASQREDLTKTDDHHADHTDGGTAPTAAARGGAEEAAQSPEEIAEIKRKLENLEKEVLDRKAESDRLKRTMEDLELQKAVAAEEKELTKQKLDALQRSEMQLKQQLTLLQLRRATEGEGGSSGGDELDEDEVDGGRDEADEDVEDEDGRDYDLEQMNEVQEKTLSDAIVY